MNIPYATIEPFGWTDIPKILMVRQGEDPALLARIFAAIQRTFKDAIVRWRLIQECKKRGLKLSQMELDEETLRLRAFFAGGRDVECNIQPINITGEEEGFYMSITFRVPGEHIRYGDSMEYPGGKNANL